MSDTTQNPPDATVDELKAEVERLTNELAEANKRADSAEGLLASLKIENNPGDFVAHPALSMYKVKEQVMALKDAKWMPGQVSELSIHGIHVETERGPVTIASPSRIRKINPDGSDFPND